MDSIHHPKTAPDAPQNDLTALSPRELAARRANAAKSTGPRTLDGKSVASMNALKHGFFAHDVVNSVLDGPARAAEFHSLLDALLEEFQPETALERILIDEIAASCWRIRRILRYECRRTWADEDWARHGNDTPTATDNLLLTMGIDERSPRLRVDKKLHRAGLDAFTLPATVDITKIVRFERMVKRNLYRALDSLERIRAGRHLPQTPDPDDSRE
jgi:hypothetical protein